MKGVLLHEYSHTAIHHAIHFRRVVKIYMYCIDYLKLTEIHITIGNQNRKGRTLFLSYNDLNSLGLFVIWGTSRESYCKNCASWFGENIYNF